MVSHNPCVVPISTLNDAKKEIRNIGSDPKSIDIMAPKAVFRVIRLKDVILQDAIIIKQDMLSVGGEVAIPKEAFEFHEKTADILIMGTIQHFYYLVKKLDRHYSRIQQLSKDLSEFLHTNE